MDNCLLEMVFMQKYWYERDKVKKKMCLFMVLTPVYSKHAYGVSGSSFSTDWVNYTI